MKQIPQSMRVLKLKTFPATKLVGNLGYYETISMNGRNRGRRSNPDQRMENAFNKIIKKNSLAQIRNTC